MAAGCWVHLALLSKGLMWALTSVGSSLRKAQKDLKTSNAIQNVKSIQPFTLSTRRRISSTLFAQTNDQCKLFSPLFKLGALPLSF